MYIACEKCGQELFDYETNCFTCGLPTSKMPVQKKQPPNRPRNTNTHVYNRPLHRYKHSPDVRRRPMRVPYSSLNKIIFMISIVIAFCIILVMWVSNRDNNIEQSASHLLEQVFSVSIEQADLAIHSSEILLNNLIIDNASYTVISSDESVMILEITAPDMRTLFSSLVDFDATVIDPLAETEYLIANIIIILESASFPTMTNTVEIGICQVDGQASLILEYDFWDALYGGMLSLFYELMEMGVR